MFDQNIKIFTAANIIEWHKREYLGQGILGVILDDNSLPMSEDNIETPIDNNGYGKEKYYHKTMVCSVLRQVLPSARLIAFNWFGDKEGATKWILEHKDEIDFISCSFSSPRDSDQDKLEQIEKTGIPLFASSGNKGNDQWIDYPSILPWVFSVGAYELFKKNPAEYSNSGKDLEILCFTDIYIKSANTGRIFSFAGTSSACPMASGMYGLWSCFRKSAGLPKATREEVYEFLKNNCQDMFEPGFDNKSGFGLFVLPGIDSMQKPEPPVIPPDPPVDPPVNPPKPPVDPPVNPPEPPVEPPVEKESLIKIILKLIMSILRTLSGNKQ